MTNKNITIIALSLILASCSAYKTESSSPVQKTNEIKIESKNETETKNQNDQVVFFETNKSELTKEAVEILKTKIVPEVKKSAKVKITVGGYCDERGSVEYNKTLGKKRAQSVKAFLVKQGIKAKSIKIVSYGESNPVDFGHNEEAWAKNRRAVIISIQ